MTWLLEWTASSLGRDFWSTLASVTVLVCLIPLTILLYNLLLHPLAIFPGPILWRASRIPYLRAVWDGHFPYIVQKLHQKYGPVIRIAPDELSFADPAAWDDIYTRNGANVEPCRKSELWHGNPGGGPTSVHFIPDLREHSRVRRFLSPAFNEKAVLEQEPIIRKHVDRCIEQLRDRSLATGEVTVNVVDWLNFTLFDSIGDLVYGESFNCLDKCEYEPWMSHTSASVKVMLFTIHLRHYPRLKPLLSRFLGLSIPDDIMAQRIDYRRRTVVKMDRRLSAKDTAERQDIIAQLLRDDDRQQGLTPDEVLLNSMLFINAASETTATALTGAISYLLQNPASLSKLEQEIRKFTNSADLSLQALRNLPYLNAVIKEALRLCNPNPIGHMRITQPSGAMIAGHYVPGNTLVTIQPVAVCLSEENFHEPYAWRPERWLAHADPASPYYHDNRKASRAFGSGPYNCIGEPLGWAWMRLILAEMVWSFNLEKATTQNADLAWQQQEVYATVMKHRFDVRFACKTS